MPTGMVEGITRDGQRVLAYLAAHAPCTEEDLLRDLRIKRSSLYPILIGFAQNPAACQSGQYWIRDKQGNWLEEAKLTDWVNANKGKKLSKSLRQCERLLYLYNQLQQRGPDGGLTFAGLQDLYQQLIASYGPLSTSAGSLNRMIHRDLGTLESLGIALQRPAGRKGGKYRLEGAYLPKLPADSAAAVMVGMLLFQGTLLDAATAAASQAIKNSFLRNPPPDWKQLEQRIKVVGDVLADPGRFGDLFGRLVRALAGSCVITVEYTRNDGQSKPRRLQPLGLLCKRGVWYLIARPEKKATAQTYRVDQMNRVIVSEHERFAYPADFSLDEYLHCSWGVFNDDPILQVRIRFSPATARRVTNLRYHPSQQIVQTNPDGSVELAFEVCGQVELASWLLSWGSEAEVLEPSELRQELLRRAREIAALYQ